MTMLPRFLARLSGRTRRNYADDLALWDRWLVKRGTDLIAASRQDVEEWLAERREGGVSARTAATNLSHLRGLYRWMLREGIRPDDPTSLVDSPCYGRSERAWLGRGDTRRLLDASRTWSGGELAAHVHLWALSGLRPGEPRGLRVEDLGSSDGRSTLGVPATKSPGRERLTLPDVTARLLREAAGGRRRGPLLLHPRTGRPWTAASERARLHRLLDDAGLPTVTPYGLRTGFITHALAAGIDERLVMISARHISSAQTARYDRLRDQVERAVGPALAQWLSAPRP
ncbi:tyrosine-type recombinase/integrase [Actinomyces gaoshouyii]|uniref:tyrosine-type recombinase/integrase n=1 Tax=Actinomyces gaoshouyii TaxID=1960083 RepID=UPI0009BD46C7|nr:site-specific integrase [Actinomyces gaoshouyii]ARD42450.1 hypothetical protein B6G06_08975 [Actinomyces gaoshouyii]